MRFSHRSLPFLVGLTACSGAGDPASNQTDTTAALASGKGHHHGVMSTATGGSAGLMGMGGATGSTGGTMTMGGATSTGGTTMVMAGSTGGSTTMGTTGTGGATMVMAGGTGGAMAGMTMPSSCGDGVCQVAMEDMRNCPADCSNLVYPVGSPGSSTFDVASTTELPVPSDIGAFRTVCQFSHMSIDDPLVHPGQPAVGHLHTFFGNSGTNAFSTYDSLRTSGNSTCRGGIANRTAYWVPTLIGPNGPLAPSNSNLYYKSGYALPNSASQMHLIPSGLHMIAGDHAATGPQDPNIASWGCLNLYSGHPPAIIDCPVGDYLQLRVIFPQCWNGVDLDSPDHKSHMAYPVNGACPSDHPVAIPEISFNIEYLRTADMDITKLRLSSDEYDPSLPGGYSGHGDYMEAWDPAIRDTFVTHCDQVPVDCHSHLLGDGRMITSTF